MKTCPNCKVTHSASMFSKNKLTFDGYNVWCKICCAEYQRSYSLKKQFGITVEEYNIMLTAQGGRCAICRKLPNKINLSVDHDHETGKIRGILCPPCNRSVEWMIYNGEKAREYLNEQS